LRQQQFCGTLDRGVVVFRASIDRHSWGLDLP
jgi:hypothetical protein